jgi:ATP-dependent DNA ligase
VHVTPATLDRGVAGDWFSRFEGAGLDGVIAKPASLAYAPGKRAMLKIKHQRTADVIVAGFRWYKGGRGRLVGSLLLGLYDASGTLHHVGVCASFKQAERAALAERLAPLTEGAREHHPWRGWAELEDATASAAPSAEPGEAAPAQRTPGGTSRWNRGKDLSWEPLRLELVIEVAYDHMQGSRFRHATHLVRWRPDRATTSCRYDQLEATPPEEIGKIFSAR